MSKRKQKEGYPYKADKTVKIEGWTIKFFNAEQTATCYTKYHNVTYVITPTTDRINSLPQKIVNELLKHGFLKSWRDEKVKQSVTRLDEILKNIEKMRLPPEQRKYEHQS